MMRIYKYMYTLFQKQHTFFLFFPYTKTVMITGKMVYKWYNKSVNDA